MKGFEFLMEQKMKILKDFEKNKDKYFRGIKKVAEKYKGKAFIFGSFLRKGDFMGGSDVDILFFSPLLDKNRELKWRILRELKEAVNENPRFEFHVVDSKEFKIYTTFLKMRKEL